MSHFELFRRVVATSHLCELAETESHPGQKEKARRILSFARQNFDQAVSADVAIDGFGDLVFRYRANDLLDHLPILEN